MLKPGELLMQLHHFAYHQQGGHRGVFRQVFELLQCAGYRLLIVTGAGGKLPPPACRCRDRGRSAAR